MATCREVFFSVSYRCLITCTTVGHFFSRPVTFDSSFSFSFSLLLFILLRSYHSNKTYVLVFLYFICPIAAVVNGLHPVVCIEGLKRWRCFTER